MSDDGERVEGLLARLTLDEKAALSAGSGVWHGSGVPRLGIPPLKVTDGPIGARGGNLGGGRTAACFPNGSALAATWNPDLIEQVGGALGAEAQTKRCHVLLGPTVNMHRSPLGGRHFESYSEDPHLAARIAVAFVRGVQSRGVATSVKHLVANDSEFERHTISSELSERALREIYLVPFEAAVREAKAWTVMAAYNAVNGTPACAHRELLQQILKDEWGFDGLVVSDWFALKDTRGPALGGLDLEMPGPARFLGPALADAAREGTVPKAVVEEKARRVLRVMSRTGALDGPLEEPPEEAVDRPEHRALARRAAAEALVLLRNEGDLLPLRPEGLRRLAVIGPNARPTSIQGGGSARVLPHYESHVLDALREACAGRVEIVHAQGCTSHKTLPVLDGERVRAPSERAAPGFDAVFYEGLEPGGPAVLERRFRRLDLIWLGEVGEGVDPSRFSARFTGRFTPDEDGRHLFSLTCAGKARLRVDGELVVDSWTAPERGDSFFGTGYREVVGEVAIRAGQTVELRIDFTREGALAMPGLKLGYHPPIPPDAMERAETAAREADAAIVVVGLNADWETEGHDKQDMALPGRQAELIERVAAANPRTAVVVNAGAPLLMEWADRVPALLWAWYGGQEAGRAIADALLGVTNPSGKLPTTFPRRLEDVPCHTGDPHVYPGRDGRVVYAEDLWVGHRHYEARGIAPHFAFGFGLSYTRFELGDARLQAPESDLSQPLEVEVELCNTGSRTGAEVVQLYVHPVNPGVPRPVQELKAFAKVELAPGARERVRLRLDRRSFSTWDPERHGWVAEPGEYELRLGTRSDELPLRLPFRLLGPGGRAG